MNLLVDLDGTITEPARGILTAVQYSLERVGADVPAAADLTWVIGPPLRTVLPKLGVPAEKVEEGVRLYRERYVTQGGMFDADLIPGIDDALRTLKGQGHRLYVATSKPHVYAKPIIAHFGLDDVFDAVHGAELDGSVDSKAEVIAVILRTHAVDPSACIMIGDTPFDVEGARHLGIPTIGVSWGHGDERLAASKPAAIISSAGELPGAVRMLSERP